MIHRSFNKVLANKVLALAAMSALWAGPACAGLGGDAAGVAADEAELHGALHSTSLPQYENDEIPTDTGMRVPGHLGLDRGVFPARWSGPPFPALPPSPGP